MSDVNVLIHGRSYGVSCDDGQEKRVRELGQYIDKRVTEIASSGVVIAEAHLLVLACLVMADELFEVREAGQQLRNQIGGLNREVEALQNRLSTPSAAAPTPAPAKPEELTKLQQQLFAANAQNKALMRQIEDLEEQLTAPTPTPATPAVDPNLEGKIADTIHSLTSRLEGIAKRLQAA
jgi:cell division protein ZapA